MVGWPPWALGCAALGLALAANGCSGPPAPKAASAGGGAVVAEALSIPGSNANGGDDDGGPAADGPQSAAGDPAVSMEPPLPSTQRDQHTLSQDHPYRDRHGAAECETDCSVHEAGYKWAALHSLHDARLCAGLTAAFVRGCLAYVGDHRG